ncbi:MAG: hypothetical protein LUF68_04280 [Clostridiales bacterium]|nr:hypothetical protein [Clostridiales bacterium]
MHWLENAVGVIGLAGVVVALVIAARRGLLQPFGAYLAAHAPEMICGVPLLVIGLSPSAWGETWFALLAALFLFLVLICNPLRIWDRLLPPMSRALIAAGVLVALLSFTLADVDPMGQTYLFAIAAGLWAVALWRRRLWLGLYRVRQSPDVDRVLSHLSIEEDWEAGQAWEAYGCRETRALLHQSIEAECDEGKMHRTYMPVYLLGYLHGKAAEVRQTEKAQGQQANVKALERTVQEQQAQLTALKGELATAQRERDAAKKQASAEWAKAHNLEMRLESLQLDPAARDDAILAYVEAGHTYTEAGIKYGLTKPGAVSAAQRARKKREDKGNA